jgi:hypothetical protein
MADARVSDKYAQVRGFKVDLTNAAGGSEVDSDWETVSTGELVIEMTDTTVGSDKFKTNSPGHKSVGEITLRGAMTDSRKAMCTWINETVNGKPRKRDIAITPMLLDGTIGETLILHDCAVTGYRMPRLTLPQANDPCPPDEDTEELRFAYVSWTVKP